MNMIQETWTLCQGSFQEAQPKLLFSCLFQCFEEKEYQKEPKRNETFGRVIFGTNAIQETWSRRQGSFEEATRQGGAPYPPGRAPTLVGSPRLLWPNSFTSWPSSGPKISPVKFQVNWTPFGFPFPRYSK